MKAVAHGDADGLGATRQRQQQSDLTRKFGGDGNLVLRQHQHAIVGRVHGIRALPIRERRGRMHGIARHFHRDRPKREPTGHDGIGIRRGFQRGAALRRAANQREELLAGSHAGSPDR